MKKKSPRGIPDFSRQSPTAKGASNPVAGSAKSGGKGAPPPAAPRVKPPSTSAKGGQRGK